MKSFLITTSLIASMGVANLAFALPKKTCDFRADLVAAIAVERDKGTPKEHVLKKLLKELGPKASGIREFVDGVYVAPNMSPTVVRQTVYDLCIAE
ncbi:hypothetical protein [Massilia sp. TWP1-3-3]|uniref:hypothetical protein n=1 Tax=Massilia sp. TWP1-3-3 TaxID=2804573 RepID=UPI003CED19BA